MDLNKIFLPAPLFPEEARQMCQAAIGWRHLPPIKMYRREWEEATLPNRDQLNILNQSLLQRHKR